MKGIVFNMLNDMVEEQFGLQTWQNLLDANDLSGIYIATDSYPDQELVALVTSASEALNTPPADLIRAFGKFMIGGFVEGYGIYFAAHDNLRDFLLSVDRVIHVEVRKLYPGAATPQFLYDESCPDELVMIYRLPRKLCHLAEGLIEGSADYFKQDYTLVHDTCMHNGSPHCRMELKL